MSQIGLQNSLEATDCDIIILTKQSDKAWESLIKHKILNLILQLVCFSQASISNSDSFIFYLQHIILKEKLLKEKLELS